MMMPFVSADRYDPNEACDITYGVNNFHKKIFQTTQVRPSCSLKSIFLKDSESLLALSGHQIEKNALSSRFGS